MMDFGEQIKEMLRECGFCRQRPAITVVMHTRGTAMSLCLPCILEITASGRCFFASQEFSELAEADQKESMENFESWLEAVTPYLPIQTEAIQ